VDGDPVFCSLLEPSGEAAEHGFFSIDLVGFARAEQRYLHNSAILVTTLYDAQGRGVMITDFVPRFRQFERIFRPTMLVRHIQPVNGDPRVCVRLRPTYDYGGRIPERTRGSNHLRYVIPGHTLRLTTDCPPSFIAEEVSFVLDRPYTLLLGADESIAESVERVGREFYDRTREYWREWARYLSIPFEWQAEVLRAAVTLKLCSFEESGAIVAALTTSIPESADTGRNWDYRHCWLRDAYFVVHALNRLGATLTMEEYLYYINNIIAKAPNGELQPVYGVMLEDALVERQVDTLKGYRGMGPVRVGNAAYGQIQNDSYGAVVLALSQMFFDRRLENPGNNALFARLERLGEKAVQAYDKPDSGLWEYRATKRVHTFSALMCWAAADRLAKIAAHMGRAGAQLHWREAASRMGADILERAWSDTRNSFVESFDGDTLDASLLLLCELGLVAADDPRYVATVEAVGANLLRDGFVMRYATDEMGVAHNAFNICTFWYIDALVAIGRRDEACALFESSLAHTNKLGLLSEDIDPATGELWGNFPQTYSMVGLINSAMRLSRSWESAF